MDASGVGIFELPRGSSLVVRLALGVWQDMGHGAVTGAIPRSWSFHHRHGPQARMTTFDAARMTRDLDAVFAPTSSVREAAEAVAEKHDLPPDWLNDAVKGFVPPVVDAHQWVAYESDHLRVCVAGLEHLLAMKIAASRVEQDRADLELLVSALGLSDVDQALDMARECLGVTYPIPARAQYLLQEIFEGLTD
jgi:hypothetical protein